MGEITYPVVFQCLFERLETDGQRGQRIVGFSRLDDIRAFATDQSASFYRRSDNCRMAAVSRCCLPIGGNHQKPHVRQCLCIFGKGYQRRKAPPGLPERGWQNGENRFGRNKISVPDSGTVISTGTYSDGCLPTHQSMFLLINSTPANGIRCLYWRRYADSHYFIASGCLRRRRFSRFM